MGTIAPRLQDDVSKFMVESGWNLTQNGPKAILARKSVGGNQLSWGFHFEDHVSISQVGPKVLATNLNINANNSLFFDLIVTEEVTESKNWRDFIAPEIARAFAGQANRRYGTVRQFLNRFAMDISEAYSAMIDGLLNGHFVKNPVRPFFESNKDALSLCVRWIQNRESSRIMLVMGDPGAGKSVFALMLVRELHRLFRSDQERNPAPFLMWFRKDRPP